MSTCTNAQDIKAKMGLNSVMGPQTLATPPNSEEIKSYPSFDHRQEGEGLTDPVLVMSPAETMEPTSRRASNTTPLFDAQPAADEPSQSFAVAYYTRLGLTRPEWEIIWRHHHRRRLEREEKMRRGELTSVEGPSLVDYALVATFARALKAIRVAAPALKLAVTSATPALPTPSGPAQLVPMPSNRKRSNSTTTDTDRPSRPTKRAHTSSARATSARPSPSAAPTKRATKTTPKAPGTNEHKSARAASTKAPKDDNWLNYPDYAPTFTSTQAQETALALAGAVKEFGGPRRSLDDDPERIHLDAAELVVAERLRLGCHKFLCAKRQIFQRFVQVLKLHRAAAAGGGGGVGPGAKVPNWNKTECQNAVNIDVTKASHIFEFYSKIGWFEKALFEEHMG